MNNIFEELVQECKDDYVGLWSIVRQVRANLTDDSKIVEAVIALVRRLVTEGGAVAGDFQDERFIKWELPPHALLEEIEKRWRALDRDPTIGEVVWLTAEAEKGDTERSGEGSENQECHR